MKNNRYPGVLPFEENQQLLFHGRSKEAEDILHLIKAKDLSVVFAKSGIGKTSLMQAGVMPLLNDEDIYPLEVRFLDKKYTPLEHIRNALEPFINQKLLQKYINANEIPTLWQCLKACEFEAKNFLPLFIFDQFEEFFLHQETDRKACGLQLAEMLNDRLPDNMRQQLRQIKHSTRTTEQLQWFSPLSVKMLFLIRSDKLSLMDEMSRQMPAILSNRYHLKPLQRTAAEDAILMPAQMQDADLWTQKFDYDDNTLDKILDYLSNEQGEIESFQLQILCQHLETQVKKRQENGETNITIFPTDIGDMDGIQNQYYESKIAELPKSEQHKARQLIEDELIVENRRIGVDEVVLQKKFEVTQAFLDALLQTRLIRREKNRLGNTYELSHDSLLEPIAKSREIRQAKEAIEKAERQAKELEEQKRKLEAERKLKEEAERQRKVAIITAVVAVLIAGMALFFYLESEKAKQKSRALNAKNEKIIDAFYFYEGKYALSIKKEYGNSGNDKYGFINKEGNVMIDYEYDKVEQFDYTGYAKVNKRNEAYLIDTTGTEYKVAYQVSDLTKNTLALDLRDKNIAHFPDTILQYQQLEILLLNNNQIKELPKNIGMLKNLKTLYLNTNQLTTVPSDIAKLEDLEVLDCTGNQLRNIPNEITKLKNLKLLGFNSNQLTSIPNSITKLKNLIALYLAGNQLKEISTNVTKLKNLAYLDISSNQITRLPDGIENLEKLVLLALKQNKLTEVPNEIGQLKNLTTLNLKYNELNAIPSTITQLNHLTNFNLRGNKLTEIPVEITKLNSLIVLDISENELSTIPREIEQLKNLNLLNLNYNKITNFPNEISHLENLTTLSLKGNSIEIFPNEIRQIKNLTKLYLDYNKLAIIPDEIRQLKNLKYLSLNKNLIPKEEIEKLKKQLPNCKIWHD